MRHIATLLGIAVVAFGCSDTRSPLGPLPTLSRSSSPPPTSPSPSVTHVSGVVYEVAADGRRPLGDVGLDISYEHQAADPVSVSNREGRFTTEIAGFDGMKIRATKANYSQPCRVPVRYGVGDYDVYMVSNEILTTTGVPPSLPITAAVLTGRVFEVTPAGKQTIAGASVTLDSSGGMGWAPSATTATDASGDFLLCNVVGASKFGMALFVTKDGYEAAFVVFGDQPPATLEVELFPR